ncbi:MAG: hypothetical protein ACKVII_27840 [Planctomycetales bacterium]|jgi:hypothetical protein
MFREFKNRKRARVSSASVPVAFAALLFLVMAQACDAFPVDFVLTEPGNRKQPEPQVQEAKEAPAEAKAADAAKPAKDKVKPAAKPKPLKKGIVRQKVAVAAEGAAEAAEEVGQIFGELIGGLFGRRAAPQAAIRVVDKNALNQFEARYGRHFDQIIKTELHFIRMVCQPTRQQYDALATDGKLVRTKVLNKFAMVQQGMQRGIRDSSDNDTRKPVSEGLLQSAKRHLSPDQVAKYESELAERNNALKDVAILVTAAKLDEKLVLDTEQRSHVTKVLGENWNESWGSVQMMMNGSRYFPDIPDQKIIPHLSATQKKVLRTLNQRNRVFFGFNVGMNQGIVIPDEQWEDEEKATEAASATNDESTKTTTKSVDASKPAAAKVEAKE